MAASLMGPSMSQQPSWAHVVRGARAGPQVPFPPPLPLLPPTAGKVCVPITSKAIQLAKSRLVQVGDISFVGVHPEFRDEYVRDQLDRKSKAVHLPAEKSVRTLCFGRRPKLRLFFICFNLLVGVR